MSVNVYLPGTLRVEIPLATVYWGVPSQTDDTPNITAFGDRFDPYDPPRWVALSRDLEKYFSPGDTIKVCNAGEYSGLWVFRDRMHHRWRQKIDFLVPVGVMTRLHNIELEVYAR